MHVHDLASGSRGGRLARVERVRDDLGVFATAIGQPLAAWQAEALRR